MRRRLMEVKDRFVFRRRALRPTLEVSHIVIPRLTLLLEEDDVGARIIAAYVARGIGREAARPEISYRLTLLLKDTDIDVRRTAEETLKVIGRVVEKERPVSEAIQDWQLHMSEYEEVPEQPGLLDRIVVFSRLYANIFVQSILHPLREVYFDRSTGRIIPPPDLYADETS